MIPLDGAALRRLQAVELDLLRETDRICKACGIRYTVIAGTLLGAVRHGGFIPWDDDADVAMLREDYVRFREACRTMLDPEKYVFQDHAVTPGYRWGYGKLRRRDTLFLRAHQESMPYEQGVFLDVFPLDAVPDSRLGRAVENLRCFLVRKVLWSRVGKEADPSPGKRAVYRLLDRIPEARALAACDRLIRRAGRRRTKWVRILTFPTPNRQYGYLRRWYETPRDVTFEGCVFPGVSDPEEYLTFKFGDWRTPPPEDQRKSHPVTALRLPGPDPAEDSHGR